MRVLVFLLLSACPTGARKVECSEEEPCAFGSICEANVCVAQSCATSEQCGIEQFCSEHSCVPGCAADTDCMFGDLCDLATRTCAAAECTDTSLHCDFGEFCNGRECYEAGGYYCRPCEGNGDCGGGGNICYGGVCAVSCDDDNDCPAGFDCYPFYDFNGNVTSHQCYTDCSLFGED